jgi:tetratricopeptide (TPR) repeat protein
MSRQLIEAMYARVDRWQQDPAWSGVFGPVVEEELQQLLASPGFAENLEGRHAAGMLLWCRALALGDEGEFVYTNAVDLLEPVVRAHPTATPVQIQEAVHRRELAHASYTEGIQCVQRWNGSPDLTLLDQAIDLMTDSVARLSDIRPAAAPYRFDLGGLYWSRYLHTGELSDLVAAVDLITLATETDASGRVAAVAGAANVVHRYASHLAGVCERTYVPEVLQLAVQLQRCAFQLATVDKPYEAAFLADLIQMVYDRTGRLEVLDEAIEAAEWAVSQDPDYGFAQLSLAYSLSHRARITSDQAVAEQAITHARRAVDALPETHRSKALQVLGSTQRIMHGLTGDPADIAGAVDTLRRAVSASNSQDPDHVRRLMALAEALRVAANDVEAAAEAVAIARRVVDATSPTEPEYSLRRRLLVAALIGHYGHTVAPETLAEATELVRDTLATIPESDPEASNLRTELARLQAEDAHARLLQYIESPDDTALDRIIASAEAGSEAESTAFTTLCTALRLRFEAYSDVSDLDRSIAAGLQAIDALTGDTLARAQGALGFALHLRYEQTGHLASLDDAIDLLRQSVDTAESGVQTAEGAAFLAAQLNMLGNARWARHLRTGDPDELDAAIAELRRSVHLGSEHNAVDPGHLNNLGLALRSQYELTREPALVDELVETLQRAVHESRPDNNRLPMFRSNLAWALSDRFARDGEPADLDAAIAVHEEAIAAPAAGPSFQAASRSNLAKCLVLRYRRTNDPADLRTALSHYRAVVGAASFSSMMRCEVGAKWGALAAGVEDWQEALDGFTAAVALLPMVAPRSLDRSDQEHGLRRLGSLGANAAASALQVADTADSTTSAEQLRAQAVELLDQGRGVLLTHQLEARGDVTRLRTQAPALAARFESLRTRRTQPP